MPIPKIDIEKSKEALQKAAGTVSEKVSVAAETVSEKVSEAAGTVSEKFSETMDSMGNDNGFNHPDEFRDGFMLHGPLAKEGYDWWWHSFTGRNVKTGEEKSFFIEFFTINPGLGGDEPVFGQLPGNKEAGIRPSYMMVKAGAWGEDAAQLHRFFGWDHVTVKDEIPFMISAEDCFCSETRTMGRIELSEVDVKNHPEYLSDAGKMIWDLQIDKQIAFNVGYGAGWALREMEAFQMFWHAQGMKTAYTGTVVWNGEEYKVSPENCYGYADKNWGSDFTSPWVWLTSNNMVSKLTGKRLENSVIDIGGGRPKVGPFAIEGKLLSAFWYEGVPYEFNFSKFWTLTKTNFKVLDKRERVVWRVEQETPMNKIRVEISCQKKDMLKVRYESPDGGFRHTNLWNGGTGEGTIQLYRKNISIKNKWEWELIDDIEVKNVGCEYGEYPKGTVEPEVPKELKDKFEK